MFIRVSKKIGRKEALRELQESFKGALRGLQESIKRPSRDYGRTSRKFEESFKIVSW